MNDLIERLLNPRSFDHEALRKEAAARIRELEEELDRLRAEKAELVTALEDLLNLKQGCHERAEDLLAKANETEGK
jgi:chromosome segregation ATPase